MKLLFIFFTSLFSLNSLRAAEVDQFSSKEQIKNLNDSALLINAEANKIVFNVTQSLSSCDDKKLYQDLRVYFGNHINGELTKKIISDDEFDKIKVPGEQSIYKNWNMLTGTILGNPILSKSGIALSPLIKVGNVVIGTDKFEHLFGRGFNYFTNHYEKKKSIETTLKNGIFQEKFMFGGVFFETGVFSYADLSANFNGMRFWNHFLLKNDDILGNQYTLGPYVKCIDSKFVQVEEIDFRNYFDESMDESVNCSKYATKKGAKNVSDELEKLKMKCDIDKDLFDSLESKYGIYSKHILNKEGTKKVEFFKEINKK